MNWYLLALLSLIVTKSCYSSVDFLEVYPDPVDDGESIPLFLGLTMSFGGSYISNGGVVAAQVALDQINSDASLLPGYTLHYILTDSQCNRTTSLDSFFSHILDDETRIALLGSGCSVATEAEAEISHYYNLTQLSCQSSSNELINRERFRRYFQLLSDESNQANSLFAIIQEFSWQYVAFIVQEENLFTVTADRLKGLLDQVGVNYTQRSFRTDIGVTDLGRSPFETDPEPRIYILFMYETFARDLLCEANRLGLRYPRYLLLTFPWYSPGWWEGEALGNCTIAERWSVLPYTIGPWQFEFISDFSQVVDTGINGFQYTLAYSENLEVWPFASQTIERPYDAVCYDAMWTLAYALNKTVQDLAINITLNELAANASGLPPGQMFGLEHFTYNNSIVLEVLFGYLQETDFLGLTGHIEFDNEGVRNESELRVYQYTPSQELIFISTVTGEGLDSSLMFLEGFTNESIWPDGVIPYDGVPIERTVSVATPISAIALLLATAGIIFSVVCMCFNFKYRNTKLIRLTTPNLNYIIAIGAIVIYMDVCFFVIPSTNPDVVTVLCNITPWLTSLGYSLCFGPMLAKMARVYYIFHNPKLNKTVIHDWHLALAVLAMVVIDLIILVVYAAVEGSRGNLGAIRLVNQENPVDIEEEGVGMIFNYFFFTCDSKARDTALGILYGYKIILEAFAIAFAFSIRKVKVKGLNDAKYIAASVYVSSIVLAVIFVATYSLIDFVNVFAALFASGFLLGTSVILVLAFVPNMVGLYNDPYGETVFTSSNPSSGESLSTTYADKETIESLRKRIRELEHDISQNQGSSETESGGISRVTFTQITDSRSSNRHGTL